MLLANEKGRSEEKMRFSLKFFTPQPIMVAWD